MLHTSVTHDQLTSKHLNKDLILHNSNSSLKCMIWHFLSKDYWHHVSFTKMFYKCYSILTVTSDLGCLLSIWIRSKDKIQSCEMQCTLRKVIWFSNVLNIWLMGRFRKKCIFPLTWNCSFLWHSFNFRVIFS